MENKKLILKGRRLFGDPIPSINVRAVSKQSNISRSTVYKILDEPETINVSLAMVYRFLSGGLGMSDGEILDMRVGDLFEISGGEDGQIES
jgi:hypothetical protein